MTTEEIKELAIVKRIMSILKLDDAGKIEKFFRQEIKSFKFNITKLESNIKVLEIKHQDEMTQIESDIEDAEARVEAAYDNISVEDVSNNAAMAQFSGKYWGEITNAETRLADLKKGAELAGKQHVERVEDIKSQIAKFEARIAKISKSV